jgi:outer membrane protein assembly factor BamB
MKKVIKLSAILTLLLVSSCSQKQNWPQFRGPESNMLSPAKNLPGEWGNDKNVKWMYKMEGSGWSSPIVWGNKVFIVSAFPEKIVSETLPPNMPQLSEEQDTVEGEGTLPDQDNDDDPQPEHGPPHAQNGPPPQELPVEADTAFRKDVYKWEVTCINLDNGKEIWKQVAFKGSPRAKKHSLNSYASETPVTDGKRLYVYFGMTGLFCYDLNGNLLWQKDLGAFTTQNGWGTGSSPIVYKDVLYIQNDNEVNSFMIAIDAVTGNDIWRVKRDEKTTYSTPFIWNNNVRDELVALGKTARSYDLKTGKILWEMKLGGEQSVLSPVADETHLYMANSGGREVTSNFYSVKPGAEGDITLTQGVTSNNFVEWVFPEANPGNASPLLYKGYLYFLGLKSELICLNAASGKKVYNQRLRGLGEIWASPWAYNDKIFLVNAKGVTRIVKAGEKFEELSQNKLKDRIWASVAITGNSYIFKGAGFLYCIKE